MNESLELRKARRDEEAWLVDLRIMTMSEYLEASGTKLAVDQQRARVMQDFDCIEVIERGGEPIGMMKVVRAQTLWQLVQIQLLPHAQSQGYGRQLLLKLIADAEQARASLVLSVLKVNPAKRLYDRLGFKVIEESTHAYSMMLTPPLE